MQIRLIIFGFILITATSITGQVPDSVIVDQLLKEGQEAESIIESKEKFQEAYAIASQIGYENGVVQALPILSKLELDEGNTVNSLRYLLEELDLSQKLNGFKKQVLINNQIGDLYKQELLFEEALRYYKNAETITDSVGQMVAPVLLNKIAKCYTELLVPDSAKIYYSQLLAFNEEDELFQLNTLRKIVIAYQKANLPQEALDYNLQIRSLMEKSPDRENDLGFIYNNLGYNYNTVGKFDKAIQWFQEAEDYFKQTNSGLDTLYTNLGITHINLGDTKLGIQYLLKALSFTDGNYGKGKINNILANVYLQTNDFYNAQNHNRIAIKFAEQSNQSQLRSEVYETSANIYSNLYEYEEAIVAFKKHLTIRDSLLVFQQIEQERLLQEKANLEKAEKEIKLLLIRSKIQDLTIEQLELEKASQQLAIDNLTLESAQAEKDLALLQQSEIIKETQLKNQALENKQTKQLLLLARRQLEIQAKEQEVAALTQAEKITQAELAKKEAQLVQEAQRVTLLEQQKEIDQLQLSTQRQAITAATRIGLLLFLVLLLILAGLIYARRTNKKLGQQKLEIEAEQKKSEGLLLNILPVKVAQELKETGVTTPRKYESVSILFSDFVDFTRISARSTPDIIFHELNDCFRGFDAIMESVGIEKIQTVGDGYLAVGGVPEEVPDHAVKCVLAAKQMIEFLAERNKNSTIQWEARIGIHTGPITAGVVGTKKFAYSIFGDTVNTASRVETAGEKGRVNVSSTTYELIKDRFPCEYRGKIKAKGKGELEMYFVG